MSSGSGSCVPLEVAEAATVSPSCPPWRVCRREQLPSRVGNDHRDPSGTQMADDGVERRPEDRPRSSCTPWRRARGRRRRCEPSRSVRMSPWMCSHSGLSVRLSSSISGERSVSVHVKRRFRCDALFPPPEPSSSSVLASADDRGVDHARDVIRLLLVVGGMRQQVEPGRELRVEPHDRHSSRRAVPQAAVHMRWRGLEPPRPKWPLGPQPSASTNSATSASRGDSTREGGTGRSC